VPIAVADATRRRLLKGGAAAAPLLLAITTRPARAVGIGCETPSAFGSMDASGPGAVTEVCTGRTAEYWSRPEHFWEWPYPYFPENTSGIDEATKFHSVFAGSCFEGCTMLEVLKMEGGGDALCGRGCCAALLNAATGRTPVLTVPDVINIWNEYAMRGYFEPLAGVQWSSDEIATYLRTTTVG
jgi:hypothetical protein